MRTLTPEEATTFYDKFGEKQDKQGFYEKAAVRTLCANADLGASRSVFELGCGTGSLALDLLLHHLSVDARYHATDISPTMVGLSTGKLAPFSSRATVSLANASLPLPQQSASVDRFIATYVLDLLSEDAQKEVLEEAKRLLLPGGLLCLAGITPGVAPLSRVVMGVWQWVFNHNPTLVGGCRPSLISRSLPNEDWDIRFRTVVVAWGVASEVVIASPAL